MSKTYLKLPKGAWTKIEAAITANPDRLKAGDWHTLKNGEEALTPDEIAKDTTAHCLSGWVVAMTPKAAGLERLRLDVDAFANEILVNSGQAPIPRAIIHGTEEDMLKIIKLRSFKEQASTTTGLRLVPNFN
jgi:hypothetical protein